MDKSTFLKEADEYIKNIENNQEFKLKHIIGDDCPAYPGQWLFDAVQMKVFNTSEYTFKLVGKDYSDTYKKEESIEKISR